MAHPPQMFPTDEEVISKTLDTWTALPPATQAAISSAVLNREITEAAAAVIRQLIGNPRAITTLLLLSTPNKPVPQCALRHVAFAVTGKRMESAMINKITAKVREIIGSEYGNRPSGRGSLTPGVAPVTPIPATSPPQTLVPVAQARDDIKEYLARFAEMNGHSGDLAWAANECVRRQMVGGTPAITTPLSSLDKVRSRFLALMDAVLDAGEEVVVRKKDGAYEVGYEDGTRILIGKKA